MAIWPNNGLTRDEIAFRVLLQREEIHEQLSMAALEKSLPKQLRKPIERDWLGYIRDEELHFATAFQKAVRKNIPGLYYLVMAAEFLLKVPFHSALGHFLETTTLPVVPEMDRLFELADYLAEELRRERKTAAADNGSLNRTPAFIAPGIPEAPSRASRLDPPKPEVQSRALGRRVITSGAEPSAQEVVRAGPTRVCGFCRKRIAESEMRAHIDFHLNPPGAGGECYLVPRATVLSPAINSQSFAVSNPAPKTQYAAMKRFSTGRCIGCGKIPIPGDFYCYYCAPK
jgi:hypothetical protein